MLHLAKITEIHSRDAFRGKIKPGEIILWLTHNVWGEHESSVVNYYEWGEALRKNGEKIWFHAIKTKRLQ